jgi:hypothetical protein
MQSLPSLPSVSSIQKLINADHRWSSIPTGQLEVRDVKSDVKQSEPVKIELPKKRGPKSKRVKAKTIVKHRRAITACPHVTLDYYASGMCRNCYHSKGRMKLASQCEHKDKKLYAKGLCKACYLRDYHQNKGN